MTPPVVDCEKCGAESREVLRSPTLNQRTIDCDFCGRYTRRLVDHRAAERERRRRARERRRFDAWLDKTATRPVTAMHRPLQNTPELRSAWAQVRRAKTAPSIVRRGQAFVDLLLAAARDQYEDPDVWQHRHRWDEKAGEMTVTLHRGGYQTTPEVRLGHLSRRTLGLFKRGITNGYSITLDPDQATGPDRYDQLRKTLIHEVQHALDAETEIPDAGHDRRWDQRLARLEAMFPPHQFGSRRS